MKFGGLGLSRLGANMERRMRGGGHPRDGVRGYCRTRVTAVSTLDRLIAELEQSSVVWMIVQVGPAEAYLRGVGRSLAAGCDPAVGSVASLFARRWVVAVAEQVPAPLRNRRDSAIARSCRTYSELTANLLAQFEALVFGNASDPQQPWRDCPGNRLGSTIMARA